MSDYSSEYDIGYGNDYTPEAGACSERCVCSALDVGLSAITAALTEINYTLSKRIDDKCEIVDKCKDEIIKLIDDHYRNHVKSCDECKADLAAGLGGTVEFAVACATACIQETKRVTQCDSLSDDGSSCDTCGCRPCTCVGLECVSVDPDSCKEETKAFTGWCNPLTGSVVVRESKLGSPGPEFIQGFGAETEAVAFAETAKQCGKTTIQLPPPQNIPPVFVDSVYCDINSYITGQAADLMLSSNPQVSMKEGAEQSINAIMRLGFEGLNLGQATDVLYGMTRAITGAPGFYAWSTTHTVAEACGVKDSRWGELLQLLAGIASLGKQAGMDFTPYTDSIRYAANSLSRMQYLNPGQAMDAYLAHAMTEPQLDAHWAIGNICNDSLNQAIKAAESKPSPGQLQAMRNRDLISTNELHEGFRRLGYLDSAAVSRLDTISEQLPSVNEAIRAAQKNATDDGSAGHFQLDNGLPNLNSGKLHAWFKANAVNPETVKALWRSHWSDPSVSDLFGFWHRLRSDSSFGSESEQLQDIRETLNKLGVTPYWQKHYLATMLNPLPIRGIRGAYTSGALEDKDLHNALQVTGADDTAIKVLTKEYKQARRQDILSHIALKLWIEQYHNSTKATEQLKQSGYDDSTITQALADKEYEFERSTWAESFVKGILTADQFRNYLTGWGVSDSGANLIIEKLSFKIVDHTASRNYIAGTITRDNAADRMRNDGMQDETIYRLLRDSDDGIANSLAIDCIRGIKHRYLMGEITNDEASQFLTSRNVVPDRVNQLVGNFDCERSAQGRQVAVEKLCHWLYIGAISQPEFMDRLLRLGYSEENAALLLYDCVQSNTLRAIKEADKINRQLQSNIDKQNKAVRQAQATAQRNAERLAQARKKKQQLRANRDTQLLSASEKLYKATAGELSSAIQAVKDAIYVCDTKYGMGVDECLKIVVLASEQMNGKDRADFQPLVAQLAEAAVSDKLDPTDDELGILPNSNGSTQPSD